MQAFDADLFVIGGGSGGVRAARTAVQRGARVMLAEVGGLDATLARLSGRKVEARFEVGEYEVDVMHNQRAAKLVVLAGKETRRH